MVKTRKETKKEDKYALDPDLEKRIKEIREHIAKLEEQKKKHGGTRRRSHKYREAPSRKFQIAGRKKTHKRKH
jgi:hypothetical protein